MILDKFNEFFDGQSIVGAATSNVVDLGAGGVRATYIPLVAQITEKAVGAGDTKLTFEVSKDKAFTTPKTILETKASGADMVSGYQFPVRTVPRTTERYMRVKLSSTGITGGKIYVGVTPDLQDNEA